MSFPVGELFDALVSMCQRLGVFDKVNQHESKIAPGNGISAGIWLDTLGPASSGLASTSCRPIYVIRVYQNFLSEPQDAIDPSVWSAVDLILNEINGDFDLDLNYVRMVDILGAEGEPVSCQAGYVDIDNKLFRVVTITIPVVLNDTWLQSA